jgi:transmembrane sensor
MKTKTAKPVFPPEIEAATLAWLALREAGPLAHDKEEEFIAWLEADERHVAAFEEFDRLTLDLDRLKALKPTAGEPDPDLLVEPPVSAVRYAVPDRQPVGWRSWATVAVAMAAAVAFAFVVWSGFGRPAGSDYAEHLVTAVGQQMTLDLPDGSRVQLNTDSEVAINYTPGERRLELLRGEANFTVARDQARPFIVSADKVMVRAVGTAFNVRLGSAAVEVLVTEGKVRVDDRATGASLLPQAAFPSGGNIEPVLAAREKVVIATQLASETATVSVPAVVPVSGVEIDRTLAWREQNLEFDSTPLEQVVAEFNRYNRHQLVIADDRLKEQRFTGKFRPDGYDGLIRLLRTSFGVEAREEGDRTILRAQP